MDALKNLFRRSQPWAVVIPLEVLELARRDFERLCAGKSPVARERLKTQLDRFLSALDHDPLNVLGHPPLGTDDPQVFRYTADPQQLISAVADLDLGLRQLRVSRIRLKEERHGNR